MVLLCSSICHLGLPQQVKSVGKAWVKSRQGGVGQRCDGVQSRMMSGAAYVLPFFGRWTAQMPKRPEFKLVFKHARRTSRGRALG